MSEVDYSEKQYETAANIELGRSDLHVFAPGQVAEAALGYDAAASAGSPSSRKLLHDLLGHLPVGLALSPSHWAGCDEVPKPKDLPSRFINLLIQYKRPEILKTPPLAFWDQWEPPFYRFALRDGQHDQLLGLESNLGALAAVVYASPCSPNAIHLETAQVRRRILAISHFVRPAAVGSNHDCWTYKWPKGFGVPNEAGEPERGMDGAELLDSLRDAQYQGPLTDFVIASGANVTERADFVGQRIAEPLRDLDVAGQAARVFGAVLDMSVAAARAGAWWWVVGVPGPDEKPGKILRPPAEVRTMREWVEMPDRTKGVGS